MNRRNYGDSLVNKKTVVFCSQEPYDFSRGRFRREYDVISLEDLNVSGILKNHKLARSVSDVSWSQFVTMLQYKADWYGKEIVKIDRFFASSQLCSVCGYKNTKTKDLSVRSWVCPVCGTSHDRDVNASINILKEGLKQIV